MTTTSSASFALLILTSNTKCFEFIILEKIKKNIFLRYLREKKKSWQQRHHADARSSNPARSLCVTSGGCRGEGFYFLERGEGKASCVCACACARVCSTTGLSAFSYVGPGCAALIFRREWCVPTYTHTHSHTRNISLYIFITNCVCVCHL